MFDTKRTKQTNLFKSMQLLRLQHELKLIDEKLEQNRSTPICAEDNFFKRLINSGNNKIKDYKSINLSEIKAAIQAEIDKLTKNTNGASITLYNESEILRIASDVFSSDDYSLEKTMFSISLIFDGEYNYEFDSEGLSYLSRLLWEDEAKLADIKRFIPQINSCGDYSFISPLNWAVAADVIKNDEMYSIATAVEKSSKENFDND